METIYKLLVIAAALSGLWIGMKRGMLKQLMPLLGIAFGIMAARLFTPEMAQWLYTKIETWHGNFAQDIIYSVYASSIIFALIYFCFALASGILNKITSCIETGATDKVIGTIFGMVRNMLFISIVYNMIAVVNPKSPLVEAQMASDGNLIELVMPIAPVLLDNGCDDYEHRIKLEEAKAIS